MTGHVRQTLLRRPSPTQPNEIMVNLMCRAFTAMSLLLSAACDSQPATEDDFAIARRKMVQEQLTAAGRDIKNPRVLEAMGTVPRHEFVPATVRKFAYADEPLPIGFGQTISQPFIV